MTKFGTKGIQEVLKYKFEIYLSLMGQGMPQMQSKALFSIGSIRLVCLIFTLEKYHFLLELLSIFHISIQKLKFCSTLFKDKHTTKHSLPVLSTPERKQVMT